MDTELFFQTETYVSLLTLTAMETVLGIDNIVFISILTGRLPQEQQAKARRLGLSLALVLRLGLLLAISWVMSLTNPLFAIWGKTISGRDLILLLGGIFLIAKSTHEIYEKLEVPHEEAAGTAAGKAAAFGWIILQILLLDIVFSLDSVVTAVGMASHVPIMVTAMLISVGIMLVFAGKIGDFVNNHPSMKILALSFLLLIGVMLTAEGWGSHVSKGYVYAAMAFSLLVELLNMRFRARKSPVALHARFAEAEADQAPPP
ncbi:MAG: TerC family protein [Polyangiaceae bacterium]|nr:TerC family protein [Polyangiaceae bacterium]